MEVGKIADAEVAVDQVTLNHTRFVTA